jgi:putative membrane protein
MSADEREPDVRFSLANERTLLAYQRTAIGLVAAAVAVAHFLDNDLLAVLIAAVLLLSGGVAAIGGYYRYRDADRAIRAGRPLPGGPIPLLLSVGLTVCLILAAAYVVVTAT